jgi:2-keto-4-pentenoate hydratase
METQLSAATPVALAECRRAGTISELPLHKLGNRTEAGAFQVAAVKTFGGESCGYKIGATSPAVQQLLQCREPIYGPVLQENVLSNGASFRMPAGVLGIECEFAFRMGRDFPAPSDELNVSSLQSAILECFVALEIVGRRVVADIPLTELSAIADFALNVAVVRGEPIAEWQTQDLAAMPVLAMVDGVNAASGTGAQVFGHPLNALLWLARALQSRGMTLRKGEIILTGTCTGVTKVAPGQTFEARFSDYPPLRIQII